MNKPEMLLASGKPIGPHKLRLDDKIIMAMPKECMFYADAPIDSGFDKYLNKICFVRTKSGDEHICQLRRGYTEGRYNLACPDDHPIDDVEIEWCARIRSIELP